MQFAIPLHLPNWMNQHDCKFHLLVPYRLWQSGIHPAGSRICCEICVSNAVVGKRLLCRFPAFSIPSISWPFSHFLLTFQYPWWCCFWSFSHYRPHSWGLTGWEWFCVISSLPVLQGLWFLLCVLCPSSTQNKCRWDPGKHILYLYL